MSDKWTFLSRLADLLQLSQLWPEGFSGWARGLLSAFLSVIGGWALGFISELDAALRVLIAAAAIYFVAAAANLVFYRSRQTPVGTLRQRDVPLAQSDTIQILGHSSDGRAYIKLSGKVVEFDSWAIEHFEARSDGEKATIERAVKVSQKTRYNCYDLRSILSGEVPTDDQVYPRLSGMPYLRRTRFWTLREIKSLSNEECHGLLKSDRELAAWVRGRYWSESLNLLERGHELLRPTMEPEPPLPPPTSTPDILMRLTQSHYQITENFDFRYWYGRVKDHLGIN